jgi:hypothetical protein
MARALLALLGDDLLRDLAAAAAGLALALLLALAFTVVSLAVLLAALDGQGAAFR